VSVLERSRPRRRRRARSSTAGRIAIGATALLVLLALLGPYVAPHPPDESITYPYAPRGDGLPFGADYLGRDVLSRVLWGGRTLVTLAVVSTALAYAVGGLIGLVAGTRRTLTSPVLMRSMDVLLALPPLLLILVLTAGLGTSMTILIIGVAAVQVPGIARVVQAATLEVSYKGYVEVAVARGDAAWRILARQILPNIASTLAAAVGPRFTVSILMVAALNFLGLGLQPPAADWAVMVAENRDGVSLQPWAVAVPAALLVALTIAVNLLAEAVVSGAGTSEGDDAGMSVEAELLRR
jgi:ABC-type dipeptide/oligopeptide/nickel transport system permease subunit